MKIIKPNPKNWKVLKAGKNFLDYQGYYYGEGTVEEMDNFVFEAVLTPSSYYRGRSAAGFTFKDEEGHEFTMRLNCTSKLIEAIAAADGRVQVINGGFKGQFTFVKQGANYSIDLYEEKEKKK